MRGMIGSNFDELGEDEVVRIWRSYDDQFPRRAMPGIRESMISMSSAGMLLGIVTGGEGRYVRKHIEQMDLPELNLVHAGEEIADKPTFAKAVGHCLLAGYRQEDMAVIADEPNDWKHAKEVGLDCVIISAGTMTRQVLLGKGVPEDIIIDTAHDLPKVFGISKA
jgi:phosphoglycolate phosphatase-like HAD superfamily hydrolase